MLTIIKSMRTMESPLPKMPVAGLGKFLLDDVADQQDLAAA